MKKIKDLKITVFGDSIGKGITTDNGKIEKISCGAVELFEKEHCLKVDNRSVYGQSLKRLCAKGLIDKYINDLSGDGNDVKNEIDKYFNGNLDARNSAFIL